MTATARTPNARRPAKRMPREDPISAGLRRMWSDVEKEAVPEDLLDLITRIDALVAAGASEDAK